MSLYVSPPPAFSDFGTIGLVHALVLFVLISAFSVASGAHFNPAVTVAMTALRQIKPADAGIYIVTQLAGGVAGRPGHQADAGRRGRARRASTTARPASTPSASATL